jgi:amino acid adenylation domain-containing protein
LTLSVDPEIASMMLVEYSTDLFEEETVQRFVRQFLVLLRAMTEKADRPLSALPSLPADELRHVTVLWNETAVDWGDERCVPALVAEQARVRPSAPAVRMDGRVLSFGELEARATALAGVLARRGAGKGTVVAICLDRSPAMVVTLLAILKAGAAYLPLDPDYPQERLLYMLEDSGAVLAATEEKYRALFAAAGIPVVLIDPRTAVAADDGRGVATPQGPDPGDIAYVIYTSGSTGKPKGVEIEHASFTNLLFSMRDRPGCRPGDSLLSVTTLSFDIAGLETFLPLVCGACVDLVSRAVVGDPMLLRKAVEQLRPTIMQATPVSWQMLIESGWEGDPGLRVISGGEPMSRDLARALKKRAGEVWNGYGPTETTIYSTIDRIDDPEGPITIGRPIANTLVYVLDAGGRPAPIGVPGEMVIGGAGVARGYHGRPDLTADRFVPNPFGPAGRLYRTGDLARWRNDGRLDCLGRLDNQVKVRGFRIEPGEVESVLLEQEGVKQCVVVARDDRSGARALVAYLVSPPGIAPDLSTIREGLRRRLAPHMVPSVFVSLDALPLTPNGKVDRKALPAPEAAGGALGASTSTIPPATETERMLVALWEELLGRTGIGTRESFFDLGGHSLLATRLVSRIRETRGVELPVRTVFEASTVTDLATEIDQRQSAGRADREEFEL